MFEFLVNNNYLQFYFILFYFILGKREKQKCRNVTVRDYYICGYDLNVIVILKPLRLLSPDTSVSTYSQSTLSEM